MSGLLGKFRKWVEDQHLRSMSDRELMDCGVSRTDLLTALNAPGDTRARMEAMAAAHGLPAGVIDEDHWRAVEIVRACSQCGSRPECKRWLGGQDTEHGADEFCPNSATYAELAAKHGIAVPAKVTKKADGKDSVSGYI